MLACFEIFLLFPQHSRSIIFFVYCVVSFCSTSPKKICVARLWKTRTKKIPKTSSLYWRMLFLCFIFFFFMYRDEGKLVRDLIDHQHNPKLCFHSKINFILMKILWKLYQHMCTPQISPFAVSSGDKFSVFPPQIISTFYLLPLTSAFSPSNFCALCTVDLDFNKSP